MADITPPPNRPVLARISTFFDHFSCGFLMSWDENFFLLKDRSAGVPMFLHTLGFCTQSTRDFRESCWAPRRLPPFTCHCLMPHPPLWPLSHNHRTISVSSATLPLRASASGLAALSAKCGPGRAGVGALSGQRAARSGPGDAPRSPETKQQCNIKAAEQRGQKSVQSVN